MKKSFKIFLFLLLAVPVLFIGCKKAELTDESISNDNIAKNSVVPETPVLCGTTSTAYLYGYYDQVKTSYGTVTVGNDANNIYVTYALTGDWTFLPEGGFNSGCYLFVGTEAELTLLDPENILHSDFTGYFQFHVGFNHYIPASTGEKTHTYVIPRSKISVTCPIVVAFAAVTNGTVNTYVSARSLLKGSGYWFSHCIQTCSSGSGTAYAFGGDLAKCFINTPGINSNNWGWTNKIGPGTYNWPIYAGAGQCDITKGTLVGTLEVIYSAGTATITYKMAPGVSLGETHVSVYKDPKMLPKNKKGEYITAPGQFPYSGNPVTVSDLSGDIWIAAHSGVSW